MAYVTIDSGPLVPDDFAHSVPKHHWAKLVEERSYFLDRELTYDCRCLVRFIREAELMWADAGYKSANDLIARGYELEPEEIRLAVRWLELNEPESAVGLPEVMARTARELADDDDACPPLQAQGAPIGSKNAMKQKQEASEVAADEDSHSPDSQPQGTQNKVADRNFNSRGGSTADYIVGRLKRDAQNESAPNREQASEALDKLRSGEFRSARQAGIHAGIVRVPTPLDLLHKAWKKASAEDRAAFLASLPADGLAEVAAQYTGNAGQKPDLSGFHQNGARQGGEGDAD